MRASSTGMRAPSAVVRYSRKTPACTGCGVCTGGLEVAPNPNAACTPSDCAAKTPMMNSPAATAAAPAQRQKATRPCASRARVFARTWVIIRACRSGGGTTSGIAASPRQIACINCASRWHAAHPRKCASTRSRIASLNDPSQYSFSRLFTCSQRIARLLWHSECRTRLHAKKFPIRLQQLAQGVAGAV
jgi:hypothetical protein